MDGRVRCGRLGETAARSMALSAFRCFGLKFLSGDKKHVRTSVAGKQKKAHSMSSSFVACPLEDPLPVVSGGCGHFGDVGS